MSPFLILLAGMIVVIGGILAMRLHAFLALILGALMVAFLTPAPAIYHHELEGSRLEIASVDADGQRVQIPRQAGLYPGVRLPAHRLDETRRAVRGIGALEVISVNEEQGIAEARFEPAREDVRINTDDLVNFQHDADAAAQASKSGIGPRVASGFGETCLKIGILIAMAAIIGKCLLDSGAAERIVSGITRWLGEKRAQLSFLASGFIVGIPVFFDTVFYLLIPLGKAMRLKTGKNYVLYILTIVAGATMAHSLVPPTPGPLFVAAELNVEIGAMMIGGIAVGIFTVASGYAYALWANRRWDIPLRDAKDAYDSSAAPASNSARTESSLPPMALALCPILLPVLLIGGNTFLKMAGATGGLMGLMATLGDKNIALIISAAIALAMLHRYPPQDGHDLKGGVSEALASGGVIILITAAGGAFGQTLRQTGIAFAIRDVGFLEQVGLIPLAFLITTIVRIAQGSATVAMITSVGIVAPLAASTTLPYNPVYLALAIGCGSKPILWMNDSGFWLMCKMTGMTEAETLKTASVMMAIMGFVGLILIMLAAAALPLA